jgi:LysM repeat protein
MKSFTLWVILVFITLLFLGCATLPSPQVVPSYGIYHIVGSGQTLYRISQAYGVDMKEIIRINNIVDPDQLGVGERLFIPRVSQPLYVAPYRPATLEPIEKLVGKKQYRIKWRYITLHHSATLEGNAEAFDRNHRRRGMGGLAYHFVIGNGTGSQDGEVEVGWRWRRQVQTDRKGDIQICLVGNFNYQQVSAAQFNSLLQLLKILTEQYSISLYNIRRHKDVQGKITECPGKNFPFYKILAELRKGNKGD